MRPLEPLDTVDVDEAWLDLRQHLDWTVGQGTVVLIAAQSRQQLEDMRARVRMWAARARSPWNEVPDGGDSANWLSLHLPLPGVLWVDSWDNAGRNSTLHRLNELRSRLTQRGAGCLIVCGPMALLADTVREAVDLWSVRSLTLLVGRVRAANMTFNKKDASGEVYELPTGGIYRTDWRITLPPEMRSDEAAAVLHEVEHARSLLASDPTDACRFLKSSTRRNSWLGRVLFGLVLAEAAGAIGDTSEAECHLREVLSCVESSSGSFYSQVVDAVYAIAVSLRFYDVARTAAALLVSNARLCVKNEGRVEDRRLLAGALGRFAGMSERLGRYDDVFEAYDEAVSILRDLVEVYAGLGVRLELVNALSGAGIASGNNGDYWRAQDFLLESVALLKSLVENNDDANIRRRLVSEYLSIGWVAVYWFDDYNMAVGAYRSAVEIARGLVEQTGELRDKSDMAEALGRLADVETRAAAENVYRESLSLRRELAATVDTPQARRDLSVALNAVGRVAEARGDWGAAGEAYRESLAIRRELAAALGTPQAYQDLAYSLDRAASAAQAQGDSGTADALNQEYERVIRLIAEQSEV